MQPGITPKACNITTTYETFPAGFQNEGTTTTQLVLDTEMTWLHLGKHHGLA